MMNINVQRCVRLALVLGALPMAALAADDAGPAEEEMTLDEVFVTAQKREESLQDVPLSVEAVTGDKLADVGIVRLDDLKGYVPNLQMSETGIANNIYIRGIGSGLNQGFEQSVSLYQDGVYRGRGHQARMPFLDLARVEVLRGPQPILFGKNSVAGTVNMVANLPSREFLAQGRVARDIENDETTAELVLSGPFTDTFRGRVALFHRHSDGYMTNSTSGEREPRRNEVGGRLSLQMDLSDVLTATLRVEAGKFDSDGRQIEIFGETPIPTGVGLPFAGATYTQALAGVMGALAQAPPPGLLETGGHSINYARGGTINYSNNDSRELALTLNYDMGSGVQLTSVSAYSSYKLDELCDCDFVAAPLLTAGITEDYRQYSQELRFTSPADANIQWIGGVFFQRYELDEEDFLHVPVNSVAPFLVSELLRSRGLCTVPMTVNPNGNCGQLAAPFRGVTNPRQFGQDSTMYSAFAQATFNLSEKWSLTAGGRLNNEKKKGSRATQLGGPNFPPPTMMPQYAQVLGLFDGVLGIFPHTQTGSRTETSFSPLVNVQYRASDDAMGYISVSQGSKAGGFDTRSNRASNYVDPNPAAPVEQPGTFEFEDERATTVEIGIKSKLRDGRAEVNIAAFITDYKDLQTSVFDGRIGFNVSNGSADVRGVELDGRWRPFGGGLLLKGSWAFLDFEWKRYTGQCNYDVMLDTFLDSGGLATQSNCNYAGRRNQFAPKMTGVLSAEYGWNLGALRLSAGADLVYTDDYLQSPNLDPVLVQQAYSKINARVSLGIPDRWELAVVGRNLTDKTTVSYAADAPLAFTLFKARSYYGFVDPPRAVAIEARLKF